jgi:ATP-binding cassette subfamily C (CFTR/MRP) protein 1
MNLLCCVLVVFFFLLGEALKVGSNVVLADWTSHFEASTNWTFIGYYALTSCLCSLSGMVSQIGISFRSAVASKKIHTSLMDKIMHAPLLFFESNPIGRILNRSTSDVDVLDVRIPMLLRQFLTCLCMILGSFGVVAAITPIFLAPLVPIIAGFIFLQIFFSRTRRQVKRLESIAKSPIFSHFTETISGVSTIRAFGQTERFCQESEARVSRHLHCNYISEMSNRWLSIRVENMGNVIVFLAAVFAFYYRESLSAGLAAMSVSYAMQTIDGLGWTIRLVS